MAAVTIRNLSDEVVEALKKRAKRNGRSMEAEIREALGRLAADDGPKDSGLEAGLARDVASRRSVPMHEVVARIAANPRTPDQRRAAQDWAQEIEAERLAYTVSDEELMDPWERAELHLQRLRNEQGK
ncbi:plasmid stability protein [Microbacterium sp. W4I4]|uniref:FitA-like ribbon-helix-helix domain-containing protein n=1 Tax=Microbacterium sp. W4I4 TaxID=3042295 RepID=UPI002787713F|nr:ribbon-helix-helix protein, CopG family [Microbacterium sp. W4I4]MDQ0614654.1 plasmid stability protein [Microbacterium sp. W4I4]